MPAVRASKVIAISLPAEMAKQVTDIAKKEQRSISELFREAFRIYRAQRALDSFSSVDRISRARSTNAHRYTEDDVEQLVKEARQELEPAGKLKRTSHRK